MNPNNGRECSYEFWVPRRKRWLLELETCTNDARRDWLHEKIAKADHWLGATQPDGAA